MESHTPTQRQAGMTGFQDILFGQSADVPKSGIRRIADVRCTSEMCHERPSQRVSWNDRHGTGSGLTASGPIER